jgi:hypothetical protein
VEAARVVAAVWSKVTYSHQRGELMEIARPDRM